MPQLSNIRIGQWCLGVQKRLIINAFMLLMPLRVTSAKVLFLSYPSLRSSVRTFLFLLLFLIEGH
jgi:hypothetical protein